jgi:hypothetical protein
MHKISSNFLTYEVRSIEKIFTEDDVEGFNNFFFYVGLLPAVAYRLKHKIMKYHMINESFVAFHGGNYSDCGNLRGCDTAWYSRWIPKFWKNMLPPSSGWK